VSLTLYDLAAADGRRFSPNCWRTTMALAHMGLAWEFRPTLFTEIAAIPGGGQKTVPVLDDDGTVIGDSWTIAEHLEARYPERPSLFGGETGKRLAWFVQQWAIAQLHTPIFGMIVADIHDRLAPADQPYFRASREKRLGGRTLEAVQAERETALPAFRAALAPLRLTVESQAFLGGAAPSYADYVVLGPFQWARTMSPFRLLAEDDAVAAWLGRCLDLYDGRARRAPAFY
jgi:glutathione S-transferase